MLELQNFFKQTSFLPQVFSFRKEQRLNYWVKYLSFFISNRTKEKVFFIKNVDLIKTNSVDFINLFRFRIFDFFRFNIRKYYFSFLLLKLFFSFTKQKFISKKKFNYKFFTVQNQNEKNYNNIYFDNEIITRLPLNQQKFFNSNKKIFKQNNDISLVSNRILFLVTSRPQKKFIDKIFNKFHNNFLSICLEKNLLTNRFFFYKHLHGFNKERKNIFYPQLAARKSNPIVNTFYSLYFKSFLNLNFLVNKSIFFYFKYFNFFFRFYLKINLYFLTLFNFLSNFFLIKKKKFENTLIKNIKNFFFFINFFKLNFLFSFLSLYFFKILSKKFNFLEKTLSVNYFKSFNINFFFEIFKILFIDFSKYFYLKNNDIINYSTIFFDNYAQSLQDPKKLKQRRDLLNTVMLLNFLPINLVILFTSSANKQALRDVFFLGFPLILISALEHPRLPSDYSFPGNSFDFDILYFYITFFFKFFK